MGCLVAVSSSKGVTQKRRACFAVIFSNHAMLLEYLIVIQARWICAFITFTTFGTSRRNSKTTLIWLLKRCLAILERSGRNTVTILYEWARLNTRWLGRNMKQVIMPPPNSMQLKLN